MRFERIGSIGSLATVVLVSGSLTATAAATSTREVTCGSIVVRSTTYVVHAVGVPCGFARGWVPRLVTQKVRFAHDQFGSPTSQRLKGPKGYTCAANSFYGSYPFSGATKVVKNARAHGLTQNDGNCGSLAHTLVKFSWEIQLAP